MGTDKCQSFSFLSQREAGRNPDNSHIVPSPTSFVKSLAIHLRHSLELSLEVIILGAMAGCRIAPFPLFSTRRVPYSEQSTLILGY